jgi:CheY-like chemotaxis protein
MVYKSVLLVDDDDDSNFINEMVIKKSSITESITCVKNGNEALQFVVNYNASNLNSTGEYSQIILLDLHMPVMDGFDFLAQLTDKVPNYTDRIKIFILTSSSNPADIAKANQYIINGYINKPLDINKLKSLI